MRELNPITPHERLIARGAYTAHQITPTGEEEALGIVEHWSIHQQPDGAQLIRVDHDFPPRQTAFHLVQAWISPDGNLERLDILRQSYHTPTDKARVTYALYADRVEIGYTLGNTERQYAEVPLDAPILGVGGFLLLDGLAMAQSTQNNGLILQPAIHHDSVSFKLQSPDLQFSGNDGDDEAISCYTVGDNHTVCINAQGILVTYESALLRFNLTDYVALS